MRKPDLFIVGAPKCATTALHAYLEQHAECFMSTPKEPAYFTRMNVRDDVRALAPHMQSEAGYLALFSGATPEHKVVGESSTSYLRSEAALEEIKAFSDSPKIIAMVRDPVRLVSSYFHFQRFQGWEPLATLKEAWDVQDERCSGNISSATANRPDSLAYRNVALLGQQVQGVYRIFDRDDVLIVVLDDLRDNTTQVCRSIQEFLGLTYDADIQLPYDNVARAAKVKSIDKLMNRDLQFVTRAKNRIKSILGVRSLGIRRFVESVNSEQIKHSVEKELRDEMRAYFHEDVSLLGQQLNRNLLDTWGWTESAKPGAGKP
jgi:hypothetical protein